MFRNLPAIAGQERLEGRVPMGKGETLDAAMKQMPQVAVVQVVHLRGGTAHASQRRICAVSAGARMAAA